MLLMRSQVHRIDDISERAVRDLPWSGFTATVFVEIYGVKCPDYGVKRGKVPLSQRWRGVVRCGAYSPARLAFALLASLEHKRAFVSEHSASIRSCHPTNVA